MGERSATNAASAVAAPARWGRWTGVRVRPSLTLRPHYGTPRLGYWTAAHRSRANSRLSRVALSAYSAGSLASCGNPPPRSAWRRHLPVRRFAATRKSMLHRAAGTSHTSIPGSYPRSGRGHGRAPSWTAAQTSASAFCLDWRVCCAIRSSARCSRSLWRTRASKSKVLSCSSAFNSTFGLLKRFGQKPQASTSRSSSRRASFPTTLLRSASSTDSSRSQRRTSAAARSKS
mmetsp:Transcript_25966/g.73651  ORF Transcript_25966/g.73651 Transcript_25966/m.73651 type:complete len:231 (+) Transcript_25966:1423-2115(+)